jgi:hypothetical protein
VAKSLPRDPKLLARIFSKRSINTSEIAFYNSEEFLKAEKNNPDILELYACHVDQMVCSAEQLAHNASCIETLCKILHDFIVRDDQVGTCVDLSGMVSKFLEAYGVWNYCISGSMNFHNPALQVEGNTTYFWTFDTTDRAGHVWVVAPPYAIIDLSARSQPFTSNEQDFIPDYILQKSGSVVNAITKDHVSPEIQMMYLGMNTNISGKAYYALDLNVKKFDEYFPSYEFMVRETKFRYLCAGTTMTDAMSIEDLRGRKWRNKYPAEIFEEIVRPQMADAGFEAL